MNIKKANTRNKKSNDKFPIKAVALAFFLTLGGLVYIAQTKEPISNTTNGTISNTIELSDLNDNNTNTTSEQPSIESNATESPKEENNSDK